MKKIISLLLALVLTLSACSVALAADVVLRPGDKGDAVKEVQTLLTSYGYYSGKINGSYNTATTTAAAIRAISVPSITAPPLHRLPSAGHGLNRNPPSTEYRQVDHC